MNATTLTQEQRLTKLRHAAQARRIERLGHAAVDEQLFRDEDQRRQDAAEYAADWAFEDRRDRERFGEFA